MENNTYRPTYKWFLGIAIACILLCFGAGNIDIIAGAISWLIDLIFPLLLGLLMALIFNVAMYPIERRLFSNPQNKIYEKLRRPLAIFLSLLIIFGIFIGVAFLVVPELINGIKILIANFETIAAKLPLPDNNAPFSQLPFVSNFNKMDTAMDTLRTVTGYLIDFFIGLVFSVYLLANKEKLRRQLTRLSMVWLPKSLVRLVAHVTFVCSRTFRHFIIGQATEALILGSMCTVGMFLLRLPYAPMIGSLIGVTALLPMVGAFIGAIAGAFIILTESPFKALIFIIFLLILQQIEGNLIYPRVVGSKINLPAMWVLASIIIGGNLAGPLGMLVSVPIAASAYALLKEATDKHEQKKKAIPQENTSE